ncbi:hypothetical protein F7734_52095 [Scytonema sp. UIC 10036]|uniref:hypothetical protein n=1 Tax=Scytonema sp. UIC 10036 TaxID=2304196 RepID=UPI0012DAD77A|nr:hypothetical protein [Scytonema sp. UIC 10036]MUH00365.1 hypothetical protein [Scytonema sp. UIC 10036]
MHDPLMRNIMVTQEKIIRKLNENSQYIDEDRQKKIVSFLKDIQTRAYDKTRSYTNLVIAAGYAGFFAFWRSVKDDLPKITMLSSGLLITISLCIFISSEVYNMISDALYQRKINRMLRANNSANIINDIQNFEQEHEEKSYCIWFWLLLPTIITAISGAILLIGSFVIGLWNEIKVLFPEVKLFIR